MTRRILTLSLVFSVFLVASRQGSAVAGAAEQSSVQETNDRFVQAVLKSIAGKETAAAETVFKNIQRFKGLPAKQVLDIMNIGYSKALGVTCEHCHVTDNFASEAKRPKRAAREMAAMHRRINGELRTMTELQSLVDDRSINCTTCHRGAIIPTVR
jgi:Photosynthetic reaction centre cytochrome C subunit